MSSNRIYVLKKVNSLIASINKLNNQVILYIDRNMSKLDRKAYFNFNDFFNTYLKRFSEKVKQIRYMSDTELESFYIEILKEKVNLNQAFKELMTNSHIDFSSLVNEIDNEDSYDEELDFYLEDEEEESDEIDEDVFLTYDRLNSKKKNDKIEKEMNKYNLTEWEKDLIRKGQCDPWDLDDED